MKTSEVATWFNIQYGTFRKNPDKYYNILEGYCDFERVYGGIIVKEIYIDTYDKNADMKTEEKVLSIITDCIDRQEGLATISGISRKLVAEGFYNSLSTAKRRVSQACLKLFGQTNVLISHGTKGSREYVWAIKLGDLNRYRSMTQQEEKLFNNIIQNLYNKDVDKVKKANLLKSLLRNGEIGVEEYFEIEERLGLDSFKDCIFRFKEETGFMIVRASRHELIDSADFEDVIEE